MTTPTSKPTPFSRWVADHHTDPKRFETGIPMRDGLELAADVYLPQPGHTPTPAILTMTPYDKSGERTEAEFFRDHGYAFVVVDCRGRGKSEGEWRGMFNDGKDGHDVVEWIAAQPWSDGKVGTTGLSYGGWFQWATAAEHPPHLAAMVSTSAAGRWQREIPYTDGCFQLYFGWWVYAVRRRIIESHGLKIHDWDQILRTLPIDAIGDIINPTGSTWRDVMDHDVLDEFWDPILFDQQYPKIDVPCLHVTGWFDLEDLLGAFHHYERMIELSPAADRQWLIAGPWSHPQCRNPHDRYGGLEFGPAAALEMDEIHLRWFDHWLKGIDNGVETEPHVKLWEGGANEWVNSNIWPLGEERKSYFLGYDGHQGSLNAEAAEEKQGSRSYRYDPLDPTPTRIDVGTYAISDVPMEMSEVEARPDVITYTSQPLTEDLVISGWGSLELFASSDHNDTEWHVKLTDVWPDGQSFRVCQGCLRASYRNSLKNPEPLVPGEVSLNTVELWPVHHRFLAGHRVRVNVTSSDFPWFARSLNQFGPIKTLEEPKVAINTIHHGVSHPSRLILPMVSVGASD